MDKISWYSALTQIPGKAWARAIEELIYIAGISLVPLLFKFLVRLYRGVEGQHLGAWPALASVLKEGELLFVTIGLIASIVWLSTQDFNRSRFEQRPWFVAISIMGVAISVFFIGFNPDYNEIPAETTSIVSFVTFGVSSVLYILMTVFAKFEEHYLLNLIRGEQSMKDKMEKLRP